MSSIQAPQLGRSHCLNPFMVVGVVALVVDDGVVVVSVRRLFIVLVAVI